MSFYNCKSALMIAGDKLKHLEKINDLKCDIAIINLEDAVFDKDFAREQVVTFLKNREFNKKIVVRVNDLNDCGIRDIKALNNVKPDAIRVPKIKDKNDVKQALDLIDDDIELHLSIETKEAFNNIKTLKINNRVTTLYLGILDLLADLNISQNILTIDNPTIDYILTKFLIDSKASSLYPISFVYQDYKNLDEFKLWCQKEKKLGFNAKSAISPKQVDIINSIFEINENIIQKAKYIKKVFEKNRSEGCTGFSDDNYGFIDEPIYKDALNILKNL